MQADKLHPNLRAYQDGDLVRHPLVISSHPDVKEINRWYNLKKAGIATALREEDWERYVVLHERPYRVMALKNLLKMRAVAFSQLWPVVGWIWVDTEFPFYEVAFWRRVWGSPDPLKRSAMDADDLLKFEQLPEEFPVWRGVGCEKAAYGLSWTLDRNVGVYFAKRFGSIPTLAQGKARKDRIAAYFTGRKELEVVILPEHVSEVFIQEL
jgi:hypothetical protein